MRNYFNRLVQLAVWVIALLAMFGCGDKLSMEKAARNCTTNPTTGGLECPTSIR